jgi:hypothetical protein
MRVAIMQPYILPYIGYFQLISAVDRFVIYDDIKYTKKGWINRNRMLLNGRGTLFSIPIKGASDRLHIRDRKLALDFDRGKLLNAFREAYRSAPYFSVTFPLLETIVWHNEENLFGFLHYSIVRTCDHLGIATRIEVSSAFDIDHGLKGEAKVMALCAATGADIYINPIGGTELYSASSFADRGVDLSFLRSNEISYDQLGGPFIPWLSIVDVMMFNSIDAIKEKFLSSYELI